MANGMVPTSDEILQYARENGILDVASICDQIEMKKNEEYLAMHPFELWEAKDGQWNTYFPDEEKGRVRRHRKTREELEQLVIEYWKSKVENPTFREVFEEMEQRKLSLKQIVRSSYDRHMRTYNTHCAEFGKRKIKDITPTEVEDFLEEQIAEHDLTAKAFCSLKTLVKWTFKRAKKLGIISYSVEQVFADMDFSEASFKKTLKEDFEEVFSEEETEQLIRYLIDNPDPLNCGLLLALLTGIRVGELATLKHADFDEGILSIRRTETKYHDDDGHVVYDIKEFPKTLAGVRKVIVPDDYGWLIERLQEMSPKSEFIFMDKNGRRMITERFRKRLGLICKTLEIYPKSPHKLRKTYCTILLDNNLDNRFVTDLMGHTDIDCSEQRYHRNRRSMDTKRQIISSIPDFQFPADNGTTSQEPKGTKKHQKVSAQNAEKR